MRRTPFLMFQGEAAPAIALYRAAFGEACQVLLDECDEAGKITMARIAIAGQVITLNDSLPVQDFTFTPSTSLFIDCDEEAALAELADTLAQDGRVMMPLDNYGFSRKFTWVADRFGASWQLNLP
jgi:uncharacterized glyoxalase superfamily protein PhnB